jgi:hypothetical protein
LAPKCLLTFSGIHGFISEKKGSYSPGSVRRKCFWMPRIKFYSDVYKIKRIQVALS